LVGCVSLSPRGEAQVSLLNGPWILKMLGMLAAVNSQDLDSIRWLGEADFESTLKQIPLNALS